MRRIVSFALALAALTAASMGCAADEVDGAQAEYPEPIGVTPPNEIGRRTAPPPRPQGPQAPPVDFAAGAPPSDVIVGDGADANPANGPDANPANGPDGDAAEAPAPYADDDPAALNDFHAALDPYGTWVDDPNYGTVWVPSTGAVGDDFSPYVSGGHWAYDDDYTWVSDYSWGWAPFHYGRWAYGGRGWSWIPGRAHSGAWVSWRYGEGPWDYVGWAPLAPRWGWRGGTAVSLGFVPRMPFAFVANRDLFSPSVRGRVIAGSQAGLIGAHTQPWVAGPRAGVGAGGHFGPPPAVLNISPAAVVRTSTSNAGVMQARAFARPARGGAFGATAQRGVGRGSAVPAGSWQYRGASASLRGTAPAYGRDNASHFGGRLGGGFTGNAAAARPYFAAPRPSYGPAPSRYSAPYSGRGGYSGGAGYSGAGRSFGGGYGGYSGGARAAPGGGGEPRPSMSSPSAGGGFHGGGGGFHSAGGGGGGSRGGGGGGHGGRR